MSDDLKFVFLHALPFDGSMWDRVRDGFDWPSIAPDLYQLGTTTEEWAQAIVDETADGDRLVLVGNSVGGSCALEVAAISPVSGDVDPAPGPEAMSHAATLAPDGRFHSIKNSGHYVPLEQPESLRTILQYLAEELTTPA